MLEREAYWINLLWEQQNKAPLFHCTLNIWLSSQPQNILNVSIWAFQREQNILEKVLKQPQSASKHSHWFQFIIKTDGNLILVIFPENIALIVHSCYRLLVWTYCVPFTELCVILNKSPSCADAHKAMRKELVLCCSSQPVE